MHFRVHALAGTVIFILGLGLRPERAGDFSLCLASTTSDGRQGAQSKPTSRSTPQGTPSSKAKSAPSTAGSTQKRSKALSGKSTSVQSNVPQKSSKSTAKSRKPSKTAKGKRVRGQREIEPSRAREIQQALANAGYYKEEPSGKWDPGTAQAMSAYQTDNGFKVTGKPDALSLKKLGL